MLFLFLLRAQCAPSLGPHVSMYIIYGAHGFRIHLSLSSPEKWHKTLEMRSAHVLKQLQINYEIAGHARGGVLLLSIYKFFLGPPGNISY